MNLQPARQIGIDLAEKSQEFLMPMSSIAVADGDTAGHIHRRKQRRHSVSFVIVRLPRRHTRPQRENRLGPIQRLNLSLFVYTKDNRPIRRSHVQTDDIPYLFNELRVFGKFEVLYPVRLQSKGMPNPHYSCLR